MEVSRVGWGNSTDKNKVEVTSSTPAGQGSPTPASPPLSQVGAGREGEAGRGSSTPTLGRGLVGAAIRGPLAGVVKGNYCYVAQVGRCNKSAVARTRVPTTTFRAVSGAAASCALIYL